MPNFVRDAVKNTATNSWPAILACRAVYRDADIPAEHKAEQMAALLGFGSTPAVSATETHTETVTETTAAPAPRQRQRGRPAGSRNRNRQRTGTATGDLTEFERELYDQIPATGGIQQSAITVAGKRPNVIGRALGGLKRKGLLVGQNGVWERARPAYQERPAAQAA
jgi:hypothetical protein